MLNVGRIEEGFVLDHIKAGKSMTIYHDLKLDKLDCCVAIIKNARSNKMGKKDIIKVECSVDMLDLDILGFIDHNITVNVIQNGKITSKKELHLPSQVVNVIRCKNPRCITSIEQELDQVFILTDPVKEVYRCKYCEENTEDTVINKMRTVMTVEHSNTENTTALRIYYCGRSNVLPDTFGGRLSAPIICFTLFCMEKGNSSIRRKSMSFLPAMPF